MGKYDLVVFDMEKLKEFDPSGVKEYQEENIEEFEQDLYKVSVRVKIQHKLYISSFFIKKEELKCIF